MMKPTIFFLSFLSLLFFAIHSAHSAVTARYVRVDNPTGYAMECRQLEIYSGGVNILRNHPEWVTGTTHLRGSTEPPSRDNMIYADSNGARDVTNGDTNVEHRASEWVTYTPPGKSAYWNSWFEVDLGQEVEIEKIVFYGSRYPSKFYLDKGDRTLVTMTAERVVNWGEAWWYYDSRKHPDGIFTFVPEAKTAAEIPVVGTRISERAYDWAPMGWVLDAEEESLPENADARMARFAKRNSPEEIKKLADEFFTILDENEPGLKDAFKEYHAGNYQKALDAWKVFWFAKMKRVNQHQGLDLRMSYSACGDDLMDGLMVTIMANSARAVKFTPGRIHWIQMFTDKTDPDFRRKFFESWDDAERKACIGAVCRPLLDAYRANPDAKYVNRWAEIMDDWGMNFFQDAVGSQYEVENLFTFNPCHDWCQMMEDLANIAEEHPEFIAALPSQTFARAQMIAVEKYTASWWRQARETVFNHNFSGYYAHEQLLKYIDEFHPGKRTIKMWQQCVTRMLVLGNFRDGSMTEIGDEGHMEFPVLLNLVMGRLEKDRPEWMTPGWRNYYYHWNDMFFKYMFRHLSPGGYDHRDRPDYRTYRWTSTWKPYFPNRPSVALDRDEAIFSIPEIRRMLGVWGFVSVDMPEPKTPTYSREVIENRWKPMSAKIKEMLGNEKPELPKIVSDWMPYTGSYYFRGNWQADSQFLAMMAGGARGGSEPWLYPYGWVYTYDYNFPLLQALPVHVKGYPPQTIHGREKGWKPGTKTSFLTNAEEMPEDFRWVSTPRMDFGEAVFEGAYQRFPDLRGDWDDTSLNMVFPLPEAIENMKSVRQIIHLREQRLFLIVDRISGGDGAKYELSIPYKPAISVKKADFAKRADADKPALAAEKVSLFPLDRTDEPKTEGVLRTDNEVGPGMTIYQFADRPIRFRVDREEKPDFGRYACRIGGEIGIAEPTIRMLTDADSLATVAVLSSREAGSEERIAQIVPMPKNEDFIGFRATMTDGTNISFAMSVDGTPKMLNCGSTRMMAKMLCVVKEKGGNIFGFYLGAREGNHEYDFEFVIQGITAQLTPILRPVKPVTFSPNRCVFAERETVTMQSDTPNVEIRYTTDGTVPTRTSPLYTGPITITETTEIAARAYRLREDGTPYPAVGEDFAINGTTFTVPSFAFFRKEAYREPTAPPRHVLQQGLLYEYLEAPWWKLYASGHWLAAERTGTASRELDLSEVDTNAAYMMRYLGYLDIPADGVYTFHAPLEIAKMICSPSYDLRVYVDDEEWSLSEFWHGQGTWSIPLRKGLHRFQVDFADARTKPWHRSGIWRFYPRPWTEHEGPPSDILISGPGMEKPERIPEEFLKR